MKRYSGKFCFFVISLVIVTVAVIALFSSCEFSDGGIFQDGRSLSDIKQGEADQTAANFSPGIKPHWTYDTDGIGGAGSIYVKLSDGNLVYQKTDLSFPGRGLPVEFRRTYNSCSSDTSGRLGPGWTHTFNVYVEERDNKVILTDAYGGKHEFTNPQNTKQGMRYQSPPGRNSIFLKRHNGTYTEKKKNCSVYHFNSSGRLIRLQHRNINNYIDMVYDSSSNLVKLIEASGRTTTFEYTNGRISRIIDPKGRATRYNYNQNNGRLIKVIDPMGNSVVYRYKQVSALNQAVLETITNPRGYTSALTYDTQGRVSTFTTPQYSVTYTYSSGNTLVTDTYNHSLNYYYNSSGNCTRLVDTLGYQVHFEWDAAMNITRHTNERGKVTNYTYDDRGNVLSVINPYYTTRYNYDESNNLISKTDGQGNVTIFEYLFRDTDPSGVLKRVISPMNNKAVFSYNDYGFPTRVKDANGNSTRYSWNVNGNILQITDALSKVTRFRYNSIGETLGITDARGNVTSFSYYRNGLVESVTTPSGAVSRFTYDENGNKSVVTDALGRTTSYTYDETDRMTAVRDALGNITQYSYHRGNLASIRDPKGFTTTMTYDGNDRMLQRSNPITTESFVYDPCDNLITKTTGLGDITYEYDDINRLTRTSHSRRTTTYSYDNRNNVTEARVTNQQTGMSVTNKYNRDNRCTRTIRKLGGYTADDTRFEYDKNGNLLSYTCSVHHRLPPSTFTAPPRENVIQTDYVYDALNRQIEVKNTRGEAVTAEFDEVGNLTALHYPNGMKSLREYDNENRVIRVTNDHPRGNPPVTTFDYTYDQVGNFTSVRKEPSIPWTAGPHTYSYDALNRLTEDQSCQTRYTYDNVGNKLSDIDMNTGRATTYIYNEAHQLTRKSPHTYTGIPATVFSYDANGNRIRSRNPKDPPKARNTHTFDPTNKLVIDKSYYVHPDTHQVTGGKHDRHNYDENNELHSRLSKTFHGNPDDVAVPYDFAFHHYGYLGGNMIYWQGKLGHCTSSGMIDEMSVWFWMEEYSYLNGIRVALSPTYYSAYYPTYFCMYDGQENLVQTVNTDDGMDFTMYVYTSYGLDITGDCGYYPSIIPMFKGYFPPSSLGYKTGVRHYDPNTGVFASPDPFKGYLDDPQSQHPYMYCRGNPVRYSDPSGYDIYIIYPPDFDTTFKPMKINELRKSIFLATEKPVWVTTQDYGGKIGRHGDDTFFKIVLVNEKNPIASMSGRNYAVEVFVPNVQKDLMTARDKYGATEDQLSNLVTNQVLHEIGHNLGLMNLDIFGSGIGHSNDPSSIMFNDSSKFLNNVIRFKASEIKLIQQHKKY